MWCNPQLPKLLCTLNTKAPSPNTGSKPGTQVQCSQGPMQSQLCQPLPTWALLGKEEDFRGTWSQCLLLSPRYFWGKSSTVSPVLEAKANVLFPLLEFFKKSHMNYWELFIGEAFCEGWCSASFVLTLTASSFFSDLLNIKKITICLQKPKREL